MKKVNFYVLHDMINKKTGRSYKEDNLLLKHKFNIGDLVELKPEGLRLYIASQDRDCDKSLLYSLTINIDEYNDAIKEANKNWYPEKRFGTHHMSTMGYPESSLKLIKKMAIKPKLL